MACETMAAYKGGNVARARVTPRVRRAEVGVGAHGRVGTERIGRIRASVFDKWGRVICAWHAAPSACVIVPVVFCNCAYCIGVWWPDEGLQRTG